MKTKIFFLALTLVSCKNIDTPVDKSKLLGSDYRLFQQTPAWELAKAVKLGDTVKIKEQVKRQKGLIDYSEPLYGQTLTKMAVGNLNYNSVKTLLELGADPNKQDKYDGTSALMESAKIGGEGYQHKNADPRYLRLLLKYGGDPNAVQKGDLVRGNHTQFTPLVIACFSGVLEYVKLLVEAGADIKPNAGVGSRALYAAIVAKNPDIVIYLLRKGANFTEPMYTTIDGEKKYILDAINNMWDFEKNSPEYKKEIQIKDFLKTRNKL